MALLTMSLLTALQLRHIAHLRALSFIHLYFVSSFWIESTPLVWLPAYQLFLFTTFCGWTPFHTSDTIAVYALLLCRERHSQKDLSSRSAVYIYIVMLASNSVWDIRHISAITGVRQLILHNSVYVKTVLQLGLYQLVEDGAHTHAHTHVHTE